MKSMYAHFPINLVIPKEYDEVTINNFLGNKIKDCKIKMYKGVTVEATKNKDEIVLQGNDIELVGKCASLIQQYTRVKNKDIRKFLDGIYVSESGTVEEE